MVKDDPGIFFEKRKQRHFWDAKTPHELYSKLLKGGYIGIQGILDRSIIGVAQGDTRSLDYMAHIYEVGFCHRF